MAIEKPPVEAWISLGAASIVGFFTLFAILTVSPLLQQIIGDLSLTFAEGGLLFSVLVALIVVGALVGGYLGDRVGIKKALGVGAVFVGVGAPLRGVTTGYAPLLSMMALVGLGYGFLLPNLPKLAQGWFPRKYLGRVTGIYMSSLFAGAAFAISTTIPLSFLLGNSWRETLLTFGAFSSAAAVVWWLLAKSPTTFDLMGGKDNVSREGGGPVWTNRQVWLVAVILTWMNVFFYTLGGWLPTIFSERGSPPYFASLMTSTTYFLAIPATLVIPILSDRLGRRKPFMLALGLVAAAASYGLLVVPLGFGWVLAAVLGFATAGIMVVCYMLPVEIVSKNALGKASGIIVSVGFVGGIVGPFTAGFLRDMTQSFSAVILLLVVAAVFATAIAFFIGETGSKGKKRVAADS